MKGFLQVFLLADILAAHSKQGISDSRPERDAGCGLTINEIGLGDWEVVFMIPQKSLMDSSLLL